SKSIQITCQITLSPLRNEIIRMKNFYEVLGLTPDASPEQVKAAFHKLAKDSHPDVNAGDATAEKRFKEINHAQEVLSDSAKRAEYDRDLKRMRAKALRRTRSAVAIVAVSFFLTIGGGLYLAGRYQPADQPRIVSPAPPSKPEMLDVYAGRL